jgi:hypothetical protein
VVIFAAVSPLVLMKPAYQGVCRKFFSGFSYRQRSCRKLRQKAAGGTSKMTIGFKGIHDPKSVILNAVFFYVRYPVSHRDLKEIMGTTLIMRP